MSQTQPQSSFPLFKTILSLAACALVVFGVSSVLLPVWFDQAAAKKAILYAGGIVTACSILAVIPVGVLGPRGMMPTVYAYFAGMSVRFVVCFVAAITAVKSNWLPGPVLLVALVFFYTPLLAVEVAFVARYLWQKDAPSAGSIPADDDKPLPQSTEATA